ncbi:VOC family protein [Halosimplex aquaticum]|uniref:VOC family protein n=1 Tax=Halosimplex aquaticum TaxID=3026162 RepID=A0ABD5Y0S7_9EURY|nr:VOC family protein [Halosimplex aquaticum]
MKLSTVYVGVEDMDRALAFYEDVFQAEPEQAEQRFSIFEFDGADFGLYNAGADGHEFDFGNNCVPNFEVEDVDSAYERISALAPEVVSDGIFDIDGYRGFHFLDTEGNTIEVFSIDSE